MAPFHRIGVSGSNGVIKERQETPSFHSDASLRLTPAIAMVLIMLRALQNQTDLSCLWQLHWSKTSLSIQMLS